MSGLGLSLVLYIWMEKEIKRLISEYSATSKSNHSKVIYCFDCDEYNRDPDDSKFLEDAKKYCDDKGYYFVWFCKDIERVYIGKKVDDSQKKKEAATFKVKKLISNIDSSSLSEDDYRINTSNIMSVLDQNQELVRKTDSFMDLIGK